MRGEESVPEDERMTVRHSESSMRKTERLESETVESLSVGSVVQNESSAIQFLCSPNTAADHYQEI